jgi:hypothetical protein
MKISIGWIVAGVLAIVLAVLLLKDCGGKPDIVQTTNDSITYWKNAYGQTIASQIKKETDFAKTTAGYLDSIAKLHNTNKKDIKEAVQVALRGQATIKGSGNVKIVYEPVYVDSGSYSPPPCPPQIKSLSEIFTDPYYTIQATISTEDSSFVEITTLDTVTLVTKEVKEGNLFNRRSYLQVDVRNANPHNQVVGLKVYRVAESKPKRFGVGLQTGFRVRMGRPEPYYGVGISWSPIRF